jgi:hypothetical protein
VFKLFITSENNLDRSFNAYEYGEKPLINNFDPFVEISGSRVFIYGNNSECELDLTEIKTMKIEKKSVN